MGFWGYIGKFGKNVRGIYHGTAGSSDPIDSKLDGKILLKNKKDIQKDFVRVYPKNHPGNMKKKSS